MNKFIVSAFVAGGWVLAATAGVGATHADFTHAYQPQIVRGDTTRSTTEYPNSQVGWMHARVNNATQVGANPLVCVEAFKGKMKAHLGCLRLNLGGQGFTQANWGEQFNAPTHWLTTPGRYRVVYTYQDQFGAWHRINGANGANWDGVVVH